MIKIAILGPESTGKSTLAKALAEHFDTQWIPEFAREYIENLTVPYTFDDVCNIARKQIKQEKEVDENFADKFIFFDTDLIITKVWLQYRFGVVPQFITDWMLAQNFDFYLLCAPDLPWEFDPVREHGHDREYFFDWYKREIEQTGKPFKIIEGIGNQRIENAANAIISFVTRTL